MTEFLQVTYGAETWAQGSRGRSGSFRGGGLPLIKNLRMLRDGSLVVRPSWFKWGWHVNTAAFKMLSGQSRSEFAVFWPCFYRDDVLSNPIGALALLDTGGLKIFNRDTLAQPVTELFTDTNSVALNQFGFGYIDQIDSYNALAQGALVESQGVGALSGKITSGRSSIAPAFLGGGRSFFYVGSTIHQGRAFYWGFESETVNNTLIRSNRIWFSDSYLYTTFSEDTQFIEVDGEVRGCISIGPNLLIWTVQGNWYVLQGRGNPIRATLHSKGRNRIPGVDDQAARFSDIALFNSADYDITAIIDREGNIDSETLSRFGDPEVKALGTRRSPAAASPQQDALTVPGSVLGEAIHLSRGVWVEEGWTLDRSITDRTVLRSHPERNKEFLALPVEDSGSYDFQIYERETLANTPSLYLDQTGFQPVETVQGELTTPRIWDPDKDVRVVQVTIDCRYWATFGSSNVYDDPAMTVEISDSLTDANNPAVIGPDANMISLLSAPAVGASVRLVATPTGGPLSFASWTEVQIKGIQSFAIEQVMVEYELSSRREH